MQRVVTPAGVNRWHHNLQFPVSVLGDPTDDTRGRLVAADVWPIAVRPTMTTRQTPASVPAGAWAAGCGRISSVKMDPGNTNGVCLRVNTSFWVLVENSSTVLGSGTLALAGGDVAFGEPAWSTGELGRVAAGT